MATEREKKLEQLLSDIVHDFDQTGCSVGVGTVSTVFINGAREYLGLDLLPEDEDEDDSLDGDSETDMDISPDDESTS